jgi:hypothetical protein
MKKGLPIIILVAVLFVFFVGFSINTWYERPQYDDFCEEVVAPEPERVSSELPTKADLDDCFAQLEEAREAYSVKVGLILIAIGFLAIIFGLKFSKLEANTTLGLIWGGVLTVLYGVIVFWDSIENNFKPIVIGGLLILVIYLGNKYKGLLK